MGENLRSAFKYWVMAVIKPSATFSLFRSNVSKLSISLLILTIFGLMYAFTACLLHLAGVLPAIEPWIPVAKEEYYLYQAFWTVPWGIATAILMAGTAHVMATIGRGSRASAGFEDALLVNVLAWVVPSFVLMWLPETLVVTIVGRTPWPPWIEVLRLAVLAPLWQIMLATQGMRLTHGAGLPRALAIGVVVTGVGFAMFLPVMR
jgi:hypothetical protein